MPNAPDPNKILLLILLLFTADVILFFVLRESILTVIVIVQELIKTTVIIAKKIAQDKKTPKISKSQELWEETEDLESSKVKDLESPEVLKCKGFFDPSNIQYILILYLSFFLCNNDSCFIFLCF